MSNFSLTHANPSFEVNIFYPEAVNNIASLGQLEKSLGGKFNSAMWYLDWSDNFTPGIARSFQGHGTQPTLVWQPQINGAGLSYAKVSSGSYDQYLASFADSVRSLGFPIRISLAPEMNAEWEPWGVGNSGDAEGFKSFWKHTVNKFHERGANNVEWVWAPNIHHWGEKYSFQDLYPGDDWVDFMGLDGYNWGTSQSWCSWQSFREIFGSSYGDLVNLSGKKILITELASTESGGNKAQWITEMFYDISSSFGQIAGIYWFNINKETDWRIDSSNSSFRAFAQALGNDQPTILNSTDNADIKSNQENIQSDSGSSPSDQNKNTQENPTNTNPSANPLQFKPTDFELSLLPLAKTTFFTKKISETIPGKILGAMITISDNGWHLDDFINLETQLLIVSLVAIVSLGSTITLVLKY